MTRVHVTGSVGLYDRVKLIPWDKPQSFLDQGFDA